MYPQILSGRWIPGKGKDVFIHYGMRDYDFNTFDGWFIGPIGEYILGITTPGKIFWEKPTVFTECISTTGIHLLFLEMNPTMVELDDETAEFWHRFDTNYKQLNDGHKTKIKISKIK